RRPPVGPSGVAPQAGRRGGLPRPRAAGGRRLHLHGLRRHRHPARRAGPPGRPARRSVTAGPRPPPPAAPATRPPPPPLPRAPAALGPPPPSRVGAAAALCVGAAWIAGRAAGAAAVRASGVDVLVVGRGSNLLVADTGSPGLAVTLGPFAQQLAVEGTAV